MRRNTMSYRKPVPVYVPSPTPTTKELPELGSLHDQLERLIYMEPTSSTDRSTHENLQPENKIKNAELPPLPQKSIDLKVVEKDMPELPTNLAERSSERGTSEQISSRLTLRPLPCEVTPEQPTFDSLEKDIPPLPSNWREILAERINEDVVLNGCPPSTVPPSTLPLKDESVPKATGGRQLGIPQPISSERQHSNSNKGYGYEGSYATLPGTQSSRGRGLPREYRPPTPPLRSRSQRPEPSFLGVNGQSSSSHLDVYSTRGTPYHLNNRLNHHSHPHSGGSVATNPSFRTEKTAVSTNPSTIGWSRVKASASNQTMYNNYRALVSEKPAVANIVLHDHETLVSVHIVPSWKSGVKRWAKKVWRSMVICK